MIKTTAAKQRTSTIYAYVQDKNKTWLFKNAETHNISLSAFLDSVIEQQRNVGNKIKPKPSTRKSKRS